MKKLSYMSTSMKRLLIALQVIVLATLSTVPMLTSSASAATTQLSTRSVATTNAQPSTSTTLLFTFTTTTKGSSTNVKQIELEFCDAPLGACTVVNTPNTTAATSVTMGGGFSGTGTTTTNEASRTTPASTTAQTKIVITTPANENNKTGLTISLPNVTNNAAANRSYYVRMRLYSDTGTTEEWYGAVAQSTSQTLTINGRVQELLSFCVGATTVDDATTQIVPDCSTAAGTSVDLGTITSAGIAITPVGAGAGGDLNNAYVMVQTNATNGVVISYHALQNTSSGSLKVVGATCSGVSTADQCFNSVGSTQTAIVAGTEAFGMSIAGVNCGSVPAPAYTCTFSTGRTNLQPQTNYIGKNPYTYSNTGAGSGTYLPSNNSGNGFAWDDTGTARTLASSASSVQKVVSNEALVLKFAATAQVTTPTGAYQTQADFIATPTF